MSLASSRRSGCRRSIAYPRRSRSSATLADTETLAHPAGAKRRRRTRCPDDRPLRETCRLLLASPGQLQASSASRVPTPSRSCRDRLGSLRRSGSRLSLRYARSAQGSPLRPSKMLREPGGAVGSPPRIGDAGNGSGPLAPPRTLAGTIMRRTAVRRPSRTTRSCTTRKFPRQALLLGHGRGSP